MTILHSGSSFSLILLYLMHPEKGNREVEEEKKRKLGIKRRIEERSEEREREERVVYSLGSYQFIHQQTKTLT